MQAQNAPFDCEGMDTQGTPYKSRAAMWASALSTSSDSAVTDQPSSSLRNGQANSDVVSPTAHDTTSWYKKSTDYWTTQEATVVGMLGGLDRLHDRDIRASQSFINVLTSRHGLRTGASTCCVDVGAGIGRITKELLLPMFPVVDMLEQNEAYLEESVAFIGAPAEDSGSVDRRIACGMQDFEVIDGKTGFASDGRWDLVWIQWCIIYLDDVAFVEFIRKMLRCLKSTGVIVIKDNIAPRGKSSGFVLDISDSSIMRGDKYMKDLFSQAEAVVLSEALQADFPADTFPVKTYALVRVTDDRVATGNRQTRRLATPKDTRNL